MKTFSLKVIAADKVFYSGRAEILVIPEMDGERGILPHHENVVVAVNVGKLRFRKEDQTWTEVIVGLGFAQIANNRVTVLVDTAEMPDEIDARRAREAVERAEEQLRQKLSDQEYLHTKASLARAMVRLKETSKYI